MVVFSGLGRRATFKGPPNFFDLAETRRGVTGVSSGSARYRLVDSLSQFSSGIFHARARAITLLFAVTLETAAEYFPTFPPVNDPGLDPPGLAFTSALPRSKVTILITVSERENRDPRRDRYKTDAIVPRDSN